MTASRMDDITGLTKCHSIFARIIAAEMCQQSVRASLEFNDQASGIKVLDHHLRSAALLYFAFLGRPRLMDRVWYFVPPCGLLAVDIGRRYAGKSTQTSTYLLI